jgi:uncharacterized protein (DUF849 family)
MTLLDDGKVMVRVALNELQPRSVNPNVPYGPEAVAADAIACGRAGAAIAHVHSRHDDGTQALDDDSAGAAIYRRIIELVAPESDIIVEPTNFPRGQDPTSAADVPQIWALVERPPAGTRLEIVNIDGFRFGRAGWDHATQTMHGVDERDPDQGRSYRGPEVVRRVLQSGLVPFFGVFDLRDTRMLAAMAHGGTVPQPVLVQINLFFDLITGPTPSVEALDAMLNEWRRLPVDAELSVFVRRAPDMRFYETFLDAALARGVHPRVGLGDNPHLFSTNAEMVDHAVELASRRGLAAATPADLRRRVGLLHPAGA